VLIIFRNIIWQVTDYKANMIIVWPLLSPGQNLKIHKKPVLSYARFISLIFGLSFGLRLMEQGSVFWQV